MGLRVIAGGEQTGKTFLLIKKMLEVIDRDAVLIFTSNEKSFLESSCSNERK